MQGRLRCILAPVILTWSARAGAIQPTPPPTAAIPDAQALEAAQKMATEIYAARFREAKSAAEKTALAAEMLDAARQVSPGTADQYILIKMARDIAWEYPASGTWN